MIIIFEDNEQNKSTRRYSGSLYAVYSHSRHWKYTCRWDSECQLFFFLYQRRCRCVRLRLSHHLPCIILKGMNNWIEYDASFMLSGTINQQHVQHVYTAFGGTNHHKNNSYRCTNCWFTMQNTLSNNSCVQIKHLPTRPTGLCADQLGTKDLF